MLEAKAASRLGLLQALYPYDGAAQMIAFLGWGSLVWDPRALPIHRQWHADGPYVRTELLRQSENGRLTFVLSQNAEPVRSLWATFSGTTLAQAKEELRRREGVLSRNLDRHIASWSRGDANPESVLDLEPWATSRGIHAVVWTALPPKFAEVDGSAPSVEQAVSYLAGLTGPTRDFAEQYIRRAPPQIDTLYRRRVEAALGWSYAQHHGAGA